MKDDRPYLAVILQAPPRVEEIGRRGSTDFLAAARQAGVAPDPRRRRRAV